MNNPYIKLFAIPGAMPLVLAGLLARLPLPMTGIGIITMLSQLNGGYALAGAVSATFVLGYALLSPQISRLADRYGQRSILPAAAIASVLGTALLLAGSLWQSGWALFAGALLAGVMPSISAMVRARWTAICCDQHALQSAYSLETVIDEISFIAGPPLSVGLAVAVLPQAGLMAAALLLLLGVLVLVRQHGTEAPVSMAPATVTGTSLMKLAGMRVLTLLMVAMGMIVGTIDIVSVALAGELGQPATASVVLSVYALGSCLAGLLFGAARLATPLHRLLLAGTLATAATTVLLMLASSITSLAMSVLVSGVFFAPTMIVAMTLVEKLAPQQQLTEGLSWLLAGLNVGVALGAAAAGQLVDAGTARSGATVALGAAILLMLAAGLGQPSLRAIASRNIDSALKA